MQRLDLSSGQSVQITCKGSPCTEGIPYLDEVILPMKNLDKAWYEATRRFGAYDYHPDRAEDYNLESGGNTDLGEPLLAPFSGLVISAHDWRSGIGNVVQILGVTEEGKQIVWAGWHMQDVAVGAGQVVRICDPIGTIGNSDGFYSGAHLHNQICLVDKWGIPPANGYVSDSNYHWVRPSLFYIEHGVDPNLVKRICAWDNA